VEILREALGPLRAAPAEIEQAVASRRFATRTLPLGLGLGFLTIGLLILGLVRWNQVRKYRVVEDRLQKFRTRVVAVMDQLDALKERYKLLPVTDKDFQEPMAGATLALYDQVKDQLDGLW